ncbi:MAG: hypothetical protein J6C07_08840 [Lachnospiraceae bacterium]|nr:hypothetical protein [Lachnospiraceae bacterium]
MNFLSKDLGRYEVQELFVENDARIMTLKNQTVNSGTAESEFELKTRMELEENLLKFPADATGLKKIIVDFPEGYKAFTDAKTYFEAAYNTISAECANLGFVCAYGCTIDFSCVYTIHPNGSKIPIVVTSRCEVYVLPSMEEPGKEFVQEISNTWQNTIRERFGAEPEVYFDLNLGTRLQHDIKNNLERCNCSEDVLVLLNECLEVTEQLKNESVTFPEKLKIAEVEFLEVKRREKAVTFREAILEEKEKAVELREQKVAEREATIEVREESLAEVEMDSSREDGFDPAED